MATETQDTASKTQEVSGEVGKTGVQGERETGDQLTRGERDEGEMINLETRIMRLEEQTQLMFRKMGEMMGCSETSVDEGSAAWRCEDDGDVWQRWNGNWWIRRLELKIEEGDIQGPPEEQNGMASLLRELRNGIRAEIEGRTGGT